MNIEDRMLNELRQSQRQILNDPTYMRPLEWSNSYNKWNAVAGMFAGSRVLGLQDERVLEMGYTAMRI